MSDRKCPFCQQELEKRHAATTDYNSMFITYYCGNPECESTTDLIGCKEFWDILGQLIRTRKALDKGMEHITGLNNMIESWYKLLQSDKDTSTKYAILKSAISAYVENKGGDNE